MTTTTRMQLTNGTTIRDVHNRFADDPGVTRSEAELRDAIHTTPLRYEECARISVSYDWAVGLSEDADVQVDAEVQS